MSNKPDDSKVIDLGSEPRNIAVSQATLDTIKAEMAECRAKIKAANSTVKIETARHDELEARYYALEGLLYEGTEPPPSVLERVLRGEDEAA